jgi:hypothetical protein
LKNRVKTTAALCGSTSIPQPDSFLADLGPAYLESWTISDACFGTAMHESSALQFKRYDMIFKKAYIVGILHAQREKKERY